MKILHVNESTIESFKLKASNNNKDSILDFAVWGVRKKQGNNEKVIWWIYKLLVKFSKLWKTQ